LISAILTEALHADYWKPVQAGWTDGTDSEWIRNGLSNQYSKIFPETYRLQMAASPHIAAREEGITISLDRIIRDFQRIIEYRSQRDSVQHDDLRHQEQRGGAHDWLIVEGAGGLLVPLNEKEFVADLAQKLGSRIILVSRNYLGSINHSLLTAGHCQKHDLPVLGWIFNDQYLDYESEIVEWSGIRKIASIPFSLHPSKEFIQKEAALIREPLFRLLEIQSI
jgi:dethiobiotin synthetase